MVNEWKGIWTQNPWVHIHGKHTYMYLQVFLKISPKDQIVHSYISLNEYYELNLDSILNQGRTEWKNCQISH